jgi:hypothetical protein
MDGVSQGISTEASGAFSGAATIILMAYNRNGSINTYMSDVFTMAFIGGSVNPAQGVAPLQCRSDGLWDSGPVNEPVHADTPIASALVYFPPPGGEWSRRSVSNMALTEQ